MLTELRLYSVSQYKLSNFLNLIVVLGVMKKTNKHVGKSDVKHASNTFPEEKKDRVFAITSLICGLLFWVPLFNFVFGPLAVLFGIASLRRVRQEPLRYGGQTMAIFGLILGSISVIFTLVSIYVTLFHPELLIRANSTLIGANSTLIFK